MALVPPIPLRRQDAKEVLRVEGYTISPGVAVTSSCLLLSYVVLGLAPSAYVFATMTNLSFLAAGFYREAVSATDRHSATLLVGQMAGGSLILVLMGASSFAFHRESVLGAPAHTLDILFGWLLVTHVFYVSFSVSLLAFVRFVLPDSLDTQGTRLVRTALSFSLLVVVTILMTFYDTFYSHQLEFYLVVGPSAALFGGLTRFILVYEDQKVQWRAVGLAIVEVVVALTGVVAAILAQGELVGRPLSKTTSPEEYDLFHGNWHFLLALVMSLLYSRAGDAARIVQGTHVVCVCSLPLLDWLAEVAIFVYSLLVIILKEGRFDIRTSTITLAIAAAVFQIHAMLTFMVWAVGDPDDSLLTPRSIQPQPRGFRRIGAKTGRRTYSAPAEYMSVNRIYRS